MFTIYSIIHLINNNLSQFCGAQNDPIYPDKERLKCCTPHSVSSVLFDDNYC